MQDLSRAVILQLPDCPETVRPDTALPADAWQGRPPGSPHLRRIARDAGTCVVLLI